MEPIVIKIDPDLEDLIPGFLDNRRADVVKLRNLNASNNFSDIRIIGHSMKGAGGGYGFDEITTIGDLIEKAALANDASKIEEQTAKLADYLARVETVPDPEFG
ncbi:MAG: Hpt domain-containing protein [Gammaproteobacteria bacterium]